MFKPSLWLAVSILAMGQAFQQAARADELGPSEPPRQSTGPGSAPSSPPEFVEPMAPGFAPEQRSTPRAPNSMGDRLISLATVDIRESMTGVRPKPRSGWAPLDPAIQFDRQGDLGADWVRRQFDPFVGRSVSADELASLIQSINEAYVQNGFINTGVLVDPQTDFEAGRLVLRLVYGQIGQLGEVSESGIEVNWVEGQSGGLNGRYVLQRLPSALRLPFNAFDLETDFRLLAADSAIERISGRLLPGDQPGEARLAFDVATAQRFDAYVDLSNSRSPSVGGERAAVGLFARNLLAGGDGLSFEYGVTDGQDDAVVAYSFPLVGPSWGGDIRADYNAAAVVDPALRPLNIESEGWSVEVGLNRIWARPLLPQPDGGWLPARTVTLGVRLSQKVTETSLLGLPFSFSPGAVNGQTEVTAARIAGSWSERGERQALIGSLTATAGLDGSGSDVAGVTAPNPNFLSVLARADYARRLPVGGLELRLRVAAQLADGVLYSSERFAIGGASTVRGYRENLLLADEGMLASVEFVRAFGGDNGSARGWAWDAFSVAAFADWGSLRNRDDTQINPESLSSVGVRFEWRPSEALYLSVTAAEQLSDSQSLGSNRDLQDDGIHFRMQFRPVSWVNRLRSS